MVSSESDSILKRIDWLENIFRQNYNQKYAEAQKAYLKNKFELFGIKTPERNEILKAYYSFKRNREELIEEVEILWNKEQRDFQYFGMKLLERYKKQLIESDIAFIEKLIVEKSWWDSVDLLSSNIMGFLLIDKKSLQEELSQKWLRSNNMWLQRCSLIFQLKYREKTDLSILQKNVLALNGGKEFFINKAIGWALRQYARSDENWVKKFVSSHELHPLSRREALKNITTS